jgi:hypothetical protein
VKRREFIAKSGLLAGAFALPRFPNSVQKPAQRSNEPERKHELDTKPGPRISFETSDSPYQSAYAHALDVLARNVAVVPDYSPPVLIEGSTYRGIWQECAPHESLVYSAIRPDVARNNHMAFFALQREDGQLPCWLRTTGVGFGQIQMVVPIAATAWELSQQTGDSELLENAYSSCSRWDAWLSRYRNTRATGLCEGFCTYDTGHDNSPRWSGIPNRCPDADARKCPPLPSLPRLCPDLSATVYGARIALAAMARALGKSSESDRWLDDAATIHSAIVARLYSADDAAFFDLDALDHLVHICGDVISRVLGEHVVDQQLFETIYQRQIHNPAAFWAPYPLPSIALDDPGFVRPIPRNSWGGASQALTALRAPRWMEHYRKPADMAHLMQQWTSAILRENNFLQQMDPLTGTFTPDPGDYSPAALVFMDFTWRLSGVRQIQNGLEWNVRPPAQARARYSLRLNSAHTAELRYASGHAELFLNGKLLYRTSDTVRLVTNLEGKLQGVAGIAAKTTHVVLRHVSGRERKFSIAPNSSMSLKAATWCYFCATSSVTHFP